jgi:hypothetical protein
MKPDLVVIAVPRQAASQSRESFIRSYSWIMNWSLSFGTQEWDCVVIHPSLIDPLQADAEHDDLIRQLVRAQDLSLIDRRVGDQTSAQQLLADWFDQQRK